MATRQQTSSLTSALNALANGIIGIAGNSKGTLSQLNTGGSPLSNALTSLLQNSETSVTNQPKAYLNWILLDEQFNYVNTYPQSGAIPVANFAAGTLGTPGYSGIPITKSGYLYIWVSNESQNWDVFFDNLTIQQRSGPITEETHYYPFGLTMAGISDKSAGGIENKHKYNGIELDTSLGLNEYEAQLRDLDPQTGRWWQVDPETEDQEMWSPYTSNNDNPILYKDPRGNEGEGCCEWLSDIVTTVVATTSVVVDNVLGTNVTGAIANSGAVPSSQATNWNNAVTTANQTSVVAGTATAVVGGAAATGGGEVTVATGGLSSEVTVPVAVAGLGVAAAGTLVAANANKNLSQGNGLIKNNNSSSSTSSSTRSTNKRKPDNTATGDHSVTDKNGNTTYKENPKNPSGFDEQKRTDVKGKAHTNKDGTKVETPHVHEKGQKNVRPAVKGKDY